MNHERVAAGVDDAMREIEQGRPRLLLVDADTAFGPSRNCDDALHRGDAFGDERRLRHEAGAEAGCPSRVRRTSDVQIYFVIIHDPRKCARLGVLRIGAAQLHRDRLFERVEAEQTFANAVDDGRRGDHLGIEARTART